LCSEHSASAADTTGCSWKLFCLPLGVEHLLLQGAQAHAAGVLFPSDDDTLHRTILIANINPLINTEQVNSCSYLLDFCLCWLPGKLLLLLLICLFLSDVLMLMLLAFR